MRESFKEFEVDAAEERIRKNLISPAMVEEIKFLLGIYGSSPSIHVYYLQKFIKEQEGS